METISVTIPSGQAESGEAKTSSKQFSQANLQPSSIVFSGPYTNTDFSVQAKIDGAWHDVYDSEGWKIEYSVIEGKHSLNADVFKDVTQLRLKGASNEAAERTVKFLFIEIVD